MQHEADVFRTTYCPKRLQNAHFERTGLMNATVRARHGHDGLDVISVAPDILNLVSAQPQQCVRPSRLPTRRFRMSCKVLADPRTFRGTRDNAALALVQATRPAHVN